MPLPFFCHSEIRHAEIVFRESGAFLKLNIIICMLTNLSRLVLDTEILKICRALRTFLSAVDCIFQNRNFTVSKSIHLAALAGDFREVQRLINNGAGKIEANLWYHDCCHAYQDLA